MFIKMLVRRNILFPARLIAFLLISILALLAFFWFSARLDILLTKNNQANQFEGKSLWQITNDGKGINSPYLEEQILRDLIDKGNPIILDYGVRKLLVNSNQQLVKVNVFSVYNSNYFASEGIEETDCVLFDKNQDVSYIREIGVYLVFKCSVTKAPESWASFKLQSKNLNMGVSGITTNKIFNQNEIMNINRIYVAAKIEDVTSIKSIIQVKNYNYSLNRVNNLDSTDLNSIEDLKDIVIYSSIFSVLLTAASWIFFLNGQKPLIFAESALKIYFGERYLKVFKWILFDITFQLVLCAAIISSIILLCDLIFGGFIIKASIASLVIIYFILPLMIISICLILFWWHGFRISLTANFGR